MTTRLLPMEEWGKLDAAGLSGITLTDACRVIAVEESGQIAGVVVLMPTIHAEGLWIAPEYRRRGGVMRRLWRAMRREASDMGVRSVLSSAICDTMRDVIPRLGGQQLPGALYVIPVGETLCRQ
jgi:hypothetical protein